MRVRSVFVVGGVLRASGTEAPVPTVTLEAKPTEAVVCDDLVSWVKPDRNSEVCIMPCRNGDLFPDHCGAQQQCFSAVVLNVDVRAKGFLTDSAVLCQDKCQQLAWCVSFLWDPLAGECATLADEDLSSLSALDEGGKNDPVFGPRWCTESPDPWQPTTTPAPWCEELVSWMEPEGNRKECIMPCRREEAIPAHCRVENCFSPVVVDLKKDGLLSFDTAALCQDACQVRPWCVSFFWDPLFDYCAMLREEQLSALLADGPLAAGGAGDPLFGPAWCTGSPHASFPPRTDVPAIALMSPPVDCFNYVSWKKPFLNGHCWYSCRQEVSMPYYCLDRDCFAHAAVVANRFHLLQTTSTDNYCQALCQETDLCAVFVRETSTGDCYYLTEEEYTESFPDGPLPGSVVSPVVGMKWCDGSFSTVEPVVTADVNTKGADVCRLGHLEAIFIQDLSWSSSGRLDTIKSGVSAAASQMRGKYRSATFGLASFTDKPVKPLGYPVSLDYCYWLHMGLGDEVQFNAELGSTSTRSGNDWYEDPLDAMHQAAVDPRVGWTKTATGPDGLPVSQVMVVSANGGVHYQGDGLPHGLVEHDGGHVLRCKTMDYPSVFTVAAAIGAAGNGSMKVAFLATEATQPHYEILAAKLEDWGIPAFVVPVASSGDEAGMEGAATEAFDVCSFPAAPPPVRRLERRSPAEPHGAAPQPVAVMPVDTFNPCAHE